MLGPHEALRAPAPLLRSIFQDLGNSKYGESQDLNSLQRDLIDFDSLRFCDYSPCD